MTVVPSLRMPEARPGQALGFQSGEQVGARGGEGRGREDSVLWGQRASSTRRSRRARSSLTSSRAASSFHPAGRPIRRASEPLEELSASCEELCATAAVASRRDALVLSTAASAGAVSVLAAAGTAVGPALKPIPAAWASRPRVRGLRTRRLATIRLAIWRCMASGPGGGERRTGGAGE